MCGIAGLWDSTAGSSTAARISAVRRMTRTLVDRGPDDEGYFEGSDDGLALGHRRLSIVDLSPLGRQPMTSPSGRYVCVFNGEIYNHRDLRRELSTTGVPFRGGSDTEVMLAAIEHWGLESAVTRFLGMFAIALWDRNQHKLSLVRDRLGIKPLYFGWVTGRFVFGSELKAVRAAPDFRNEISRDALGLLLKHNYIPAPFSIYRDIYKLLPGTILTLDAYATRQPLKREECAARTVTYWSARNVAERSSAEKASVSDADAVDQLDTLLRAAVAQHMEADVPLGAFLSGGVDSSTVVALMQVQSSRPVKTFTIGFREPQYNEAQYAESVARHLGTEHTELYVSAREAIEVVPRLPVMYDEPLADSSQIPTYLLSRLARQQVTVSLSGDGGDELFAGYDRYFWARRIWRCIEPMPVPLRNTLARSLFGLPYVWRAVLNTAAPLMPSRLRFRNSDDKVHRLAKLLLSDSADALYGEIISQWNRPTSVVLGGSEPVSIFSDPARRTKLRDYTERMMYFDLTSYLPDDILTKVDRASMAVSLEARVPLLDHRVVEFAWLMPMSLKARNGEGKWVLKQVLRRYIPGSLIDRPKKGFSVPIGNWLRGPLRDWAETLLDERRLEEEGFFEPAPIRAMWLDHVGGRTNEQYCLWNVLVFQAWLEAQR